MTLTLHSTGFGNFLSSRQLIRPKPLRLAAAADALELFIQGFVGGIARGIHIRLPRVGLACRCSDGMRMLPVASGLGRLIQRKRCDESDAQGAVQQFLQIFPTILSARLFS